MNWHAAAFVFLTVIIILVAGVLFFGFWAWLDDRIGEGWGLAIMLFIMIAGGSLLAGFLIDP